jgi:hypothetical protein
MRTSVALAMTLHSSLELFFSLSQLEPREQVNTTTVLPLLLYCAVMPRLGSRTPKKGVLSQ